MQLIHVTGTEKLTDHNAGADRESVEKEDQHVDDHRCGSDSGESSRADKIADNDGVNRVVEHLENVSQHQVRRPRNILEDDAC